MRMARREEVAVAQPERLAVLVEVVAVGQLPHRGGLGDRHVVQHAEAGDDDPADHHRRQAQVGRGGGEQVVVLAGHAGQVGPARRAVAEGGAEDQPEQRAHQRGRRPRAEAVGGVQDDEHDRRRPDQADDHRVLPGDQRREHELDQDQPGEPQPDERGQAAPAGDGDDDDGEDDGEDDQRRTAVEVGELVRRGLPVARRHADQRDAVADLGARGVHGLGERDARDVALAVAVAHGGGDGSRRRSRRSGPASSPAARRRRSARPR